MKTPAIVIIAFTLLLSGCEKNKYDVPGCIEDKIDVFIKSVICERGAYVALYRFNDKNAYLFSDGNCGADLTAAVYSENCYLLGFLGGISGNQFIGGVNFYVEARYIKRIWEN